MSALSFWLSGANGSFAFVLAVRGQRQLRFRSGCQGPTAASLSFWLSGANGSFAFVLMVQESYLRAAASFALCLAGVLIGIGIRK